MENETNWKPAPDEKTKDMIYEDAAEGRTLQQRLLQSRPKASMRPAANEEEEKGL